MTTDIDGELADDARTWLVALLDQLIPPNPARNVPGAGHPGVVDFVVRQASTDAAVRDAISRLLDAADLAAPLDRDAVSAIERQHSRAFAAVVRATYMGYYSRPDVRGVLGLSPLPTQPRGYDVPIEPPDLLAALLAPVTRRGTCYRQA